MPKRIVEETVLFQCKVCGKKYPKKKDAVSCENQRDFKHPLSFFSKEWKVGDYMMAILMARNQFTLCIVRGEKKKGHELFPVLKSLDPKVRVTARSHFRCMTIVRKEDLRRIKRLIEKVF